MTPKFKTGDVVRLKSGGPEMTISDVPTLESLGPDFADYQCKWFVGDKLHHGSFKADALVKVLSVQK